MLVAVVVAYSDVPDWFLLLPAKEAARHEQPSELGSEAAKQPSPTPAAAAKQQREDEPNRDQSHEHDGDEGKQSCRREETQHSGFWLREIRTIHSDHGSDKSAMAKPA